MSFESELIKILTASITKHGNQPLTIQHLLNIVKMAQRNVSNRIEKHDRLLDETYMEILVDQCGDRD